MTGSFYGINKKKKVKQQRKRLVKLVLLKAKLQQRNILVLLKKHLPRKQALQEKLKKLSQTALQQIDDKRYDTEMRTEGIANTALLSAANM